MPATYLGSSALLKLTVEEPESGTLRGYLRRRRPLVSSALARTEVLRALLLDGDEAIARGRAVLGRVGLVWANDRVLNAANATGILNDARKLALFLTEHILAKVVRALTALATRTIASLTVPTPAGRC